MDNQITVKQNEFDALLEWLSEDREDAGTKYEKIRQGLIRFFYFKGCRNGEDLADETIKRVSGKLSTLDLSTGNKQITIFYGFASNVFMEEMKRLKREVSIDRDFPLEAPKNNEERQSCLDKCLLRLSESDRILVLEYYSKTNIAKVEHHRKLSEERGLSANSLYIKVHRLRKSLKTCVEKCMSEK